MNNNSSFAVQDAVDLEAESFMNSATGLERLTRIQLLDRFDCKRPEPAKTEATRIATKRPWFKQIKG